MRCPSFQPALHPAIPNSFEPEIFRVMPLLLSIIHIESFALVDISRLYTCHLDPLETWKTNLLYAFRYWRPLALPLPYLSSSQYSSHCPFVTTKECVFSAFYLRLNKIGFRSLISSFGSKKIETDSVPFLTKGMWLSSSRIFIVKILMKLIPNLYFAWYLNTSEWLGTGHWKWYYIITQIMEGEEFCWRTWVLFRCCWYGWRRTFLHSTYRVYFFG